VFTNFVVQKHGRQKANKKLNKKLQIFLPQVSMQSPSHQTWHGDRRGQYHFCTSKTFWDSACSFAIRGTENLAEMSPTLTPISQEPFSESTKFLRVNCQLPIKYEIFVKIEQGRPAGRLCYEIS